MPSSYMFSALLLVPFLSLPIFYFLLLARTFVRSLGFKHPNGKYGKPIYRLASYNKVHIFSLARACTCIIIIMSVELDWININLTFCGVGSWYLKKPESGRERASEQAKELRKITKVNDIYDVISVCENVLIIKCTIAIHFPHCKFMLAMAIDCVCSTAV